MADYFLDTSALGKHYHAETGTAEVDRLLTEAGSRSFISRLSIVEMLSVFAGKVRTGVINQPAFDLLRRRFLTDVTKRQLFVVRLTGSHFHAAEQLIRKHGLTQSLRTLDALQLAVALLLRGLGRLDKFVCADQKLLAVGRSEGLRRGCEGINGQRCVAARGNVGP